MPSLQTGQIYRIGESPVFIGNIMLQDEEGACTFPTRDMIEWITFTHKYYSNAYPLQRDTVVDGFQDVDVPKTCLLDTPVTGSARDAAFLYTGLTPFDYNFLCVIPNAANTFFPVAGRYETTFTFAMNNESPAGTFPPDRTIGLVFRDTAVSVNASVVIGEEFRIVASSYTKTVDESTGVVTVKDTHPSDLSSIHINVRNNEGIVVNDFDVPVSSVFDSMQPANSCMFMDGTTPFDYNFQYLFKDFTAMTPHSEYDVGIRFLYNPPGSIERVHRIRVST